MFAGDIHSTMWVLNTPTLREKNTYYAAELRDTDTIINNNYLQIVATHIRLCLGNLK